MNSFPFLRFSLSVQQEVIQNMDCMDQLSLSFCSKKTKSGVKNAQLNLEAINIYFGNQLQVLLNIDNRYDMEMLFFNADNDGIRQSERPQLVQFLHPGGVLAEWRHLNLGFNTWLRHLFAVYSGKKVTHCEFSWPDDHFDAGSVRRCLEGIKIRSINYFNTLSARNFRVLFNSGFSPDCLDISSFGYQDESGLRNVLSRNLTVFHCFNHFPVYFSRLANILAINSRTVQLERLNLSDKDLNRFLKLWKTGSMPRLENMHILLNWDRVIDKSTVFKGVSHDVIGPNHVRQVEVEETGGREIVNVHGGYDVTRADRVKAVIHICGSSFWLYLLK